MLLDLWGLIWICFQIDKASQRISHSVHDIQTEESEDEAEFYQENEDGEKDDEDDDASEISSDDEK